jgi:uncharacterized membrane protein
MRSKFAIAGHPLHPMLIALPIGLLVWAFVAALVYAASDGQAAQKWYEISLWTAIAGVITALVAALPGFGDYFTLALKSDARIMATAHMLGNLCVVGLFAASALLMIDDNARGGTNLTIVIVLQAVGVAILGITGWLGGVMSHGHHLALIPDDAESERAERARHLLEPR